MMVFATLRWALRISFAFLLCASLALNALAFGIGAAWKAVEAIAEIADVDARIAKAVAKAKAKEKAKARLRRAAVAVPFVGGAAAISFEYADYRSWLAENPEGDARAYAAEVLATTQEVIAETSAAGETETLGDTDAALERIETWFALLLDPGG